MKKHPLIIFIFLGFPIICLSQFFHSGGYQDGLYGNGGNEKAQDHGFMVDVNVFLEGPFAITNLNTHLNDDGLIPLNQPYDNPPWYYAGTENVSFIPNADIVDWLLVELRDTSDAVSAIPSTIVEKQAVFLKNDGSIVGLDGTSFPIFSATITQKLFVVIWHRNHLGIMSANPLSASGWVYPYDFTSSAIQAHGIDAQKSLGGGMYGMFAGDENGDNTINMTDKTVWTNQAGLQGYLSSDFDLDSQTDNSDKNSKWISNMGESGQVPE